MSRPRGRFARSKARQGDSLRHQIPTPCPHSAPHGIYIDRCIKLQLLLHEIKKRKERKYIVVRFTFAKCSNVCRWKQAHIYKVLKEAVFKFYFTASFLIPYFLMLIINGVPLFFMELAIGQWYSSGVIGVWKSVCPLMKGNNVYLSFCDIFVLVWGQHSTFSKTNNRDFKVQRRDGNKNVA